MVKKGLMLLLLIEATGDLAGELIRLGEIGGFGGGFFALGFKISMGLDSSSAGGGEEPGILEERECRMGCEKRE